MAHIISIRKTIISFSYIIYIDILNVYYLIELADESKNYSDLMLNNKCFKFTRLCLSPFICTKNISAVVRYFRKESQNLLFLLCEIWLFLHHNINILKSQNQVVLNIFEELSTKVN